VLPEGQHRAALAARAGIAAFDIFGMLARYGRDVAGALVVTPVDSDHERTPGVVPYDDDGLAQEVLGLHEHPLAVYDDSELSIGGLQDKMLLVDLGKGQWGRPVHGQPSTHILKLDDRIRPGLVVAEAACLRLAHEVGLPAANAKLVSVAGLQCLVVTRFDRTTALDGTTVRIHQEDACQALGRDPEANQGRGKYEHAGGPSLREVATLLNRYSAEPMRELDQLVRAVTFTILIGNADAHGKNVAVLHPTPTTVSLAPLYDTVPTMLWPSLRSDAAMSVNGCFPLDAITLDDVEAEARRWAYSSAAARRAATEVAERLHDVARERVEEHEVMLRVRERAARFLN
jgi:serine/threonine-protein kinase HipA